jgi:3-hydroxy-9,10-secoandrosta-1,3,5(10)-triene-9,17-dione monooxygenase
MTITSEPPVQTSIPTHDEMVGRAEAMLPAIRERAADVEKNRSMSVETMAEFTAAGFHKILQPKRFGGYELGPATALEVIRTLAKGDGSAGWVANLFIIHNYQVSLFSEQAQEEYWADGFDKLCSTVSFATKSDAVRVDGGWRLTGRWKFSSGCDFASWFIIMKPSATVTDWMLVPLSDVTLDDDWFVAGLSGTGSKDLILDDVFVPEHRTLTYKQLASATTPGGLLHGMPMSRLPFSWSAVWGIPAALIGMATGMADAVKKTLVGKKALFTGEVQVERVANQIKLAGVYTEIQIAELLMRNRVAELEKWAAKGEIPTGPEAFASNRDAAYVARLMGKVAQDLTLMAGATSNYLTNPIQRFQRDINVGFTHVSLVWEESAENYGRALWELPAKIRK